MSKQKTQSKYVANKQGFDGRIYGKGETVPASKVPECGASWIDFVDEEGNVTNSKELAQAEEEATKPDSKAKPNGK